MCVGASKWHVLSGNTNLHLLNSFRSASSSDPNIEILPHHHGTISQQTESTLLNKKSTVIILQPWVFYTIKRSLFTYLFSPSRERLTNCLTQASKICISCSGKVILRRAVRIFMTSYVLSFKSYELFFKEWSERFSVRMEKSKYTRRLRRHYSRYVTESGAKMLIRRFRNNDTQSF